MLRKSGYKHPSCAKIIKNKFPIEIKDKRKDGEYAYNTIETGESTSKYLRRERNRTENRRRKKSRMKSKSKSRKRLNNDYTQISSELNDYRTYSKSSGKKYRKESKNHGSKLPRYSNMDSTTSIRVKHRYINNEHKKDSYRSRSEGSQRKTKEERAKLKQSTQEISKSGKSSKISRHHQRRKRSSSRDCSKAKNADPENQLIYTFRENNDETEEDVFESIDPPEKVEVNNTKFLQTQKPLISPKNSKFSTITRNDKIFEKTLISINSSKKNFHNTGKCIENLGPSDLNIIKGYKEKLQLNTIQHSGSQTRTNYYQRQGKK